MALKGDANFTSQPIVLAGASPVDAKMMVALKSDLTNFATWQAPSGAVGGNANLMFNYFGMLVYVGNDTAENNGLYVLQKNETDEVLQANANYSNSVFRKDLANVASTYASCWVRISQTDATIEELRSAIETKQSESISVSGLTGATVQAVLEDISARLAGAATGGNLEALANRVTAAESGISALSAADVTITSDIAVVSGAVDSVAADVEAVSGVVDSVIADVEVVSAKAESNAEAIDELATVVIPAVEADVATVSGKAEANAQAIETINTVTIPAVEADVQVVSAAVDSVAADVEAVSGVAVENAADIAEIQTALEDIYTKDETDSLITSAIADAATLEIVVWDGTIAELLQSVGEPKKIYLVANAGNPNNAKDEYIYTDGKWELIGTTATDLSDYFTKSQTQSAIDTTVAGVSAGLKSGVDANAAEISSLKTVTIPAVKSDVEFVSGQVKSTIADVVTVSGKADANAAAIEEINTVALPAITESIEDVAGDLELVAADVEEVSGKADANAAAIEQINTVTIPAVEAKVETVSGKADANASEIAAVKATVETVSGKADANAAAIEAVAADVAFVSSQVDASVEGIEDAIEAVAADVETVSGKAEANAGLIAGLRTDVNAVSGSVIAFNERVDALEGEHNSINSRIEAAEKDIDALEQADTLKANSDATNINAGLWKTALGIDTLEGTVADNTDAIEAVAADVEYVSGQVDANAAEIAKKAAQTDFITLSGKVDANAAAITTKASQADFVTLSGKVDANAAAVATKASQTDLNTVSALAEANAAAVATKADAAEVSSTYLKKSGDASLELGTADWDNYVFTPGNLFIYGNTDTKSTAIRGGYLNLTGDTGITIMDGSSLEIEHLGLGTIFSVNEDNGISGVFVDTAIPSTPEDGHIATTGAIKTYVDDQVSAIKTSITTAYIYRGSDTYENIAAKTDAQVGDVWNSTTANGNIPAGTNYAWNGTSWDALGGEVDLSAYATTESVTTALNTAISGVEADIEAVSEEVQAVAAGTSDKIAKASWKSKLGFIESTEVSAYQAQVDWNATSGVTSIANKPKISYEDYNDTTVIESSAFAVGRDGSGNCAYIQQTYYYSVYGPATDEIIYNNSHGALKLDVYVTPVIGSPTHEIYEFSASHTVKEHVLGGEQTNLTVTHDEGGKVVLNWDPKDGATCTVIANNIQMWWY